MIYYRYLYLVFSILSLSACLEQELDFINTVDEDLYLKPVLSINGKPCAYDAEHKELSYPLSEDSYTQFTAYIEYDKDLEIYFEGQELENKEEQQLSNIRINTPYTIRIEGLGQSEELHLRFTNLPILQIITPWNILNDPKAPARLQINAPQQAYMEECFIGVEYRGASSQMRPKKSYGFATYADNYNQDIEVNRSLLGKRANTDWILDAMYIDQSKLRNKIGFELWNLMQGGNQRGITASFVEVFLNNEHRGIYSFNERINPQLLQYGEDAYLYKAYDWGNGATRFEKHQSSPPNNFRWNGWEQIAPDPMSRIDWQPLDAFRQLVVKANDQDFEQEIFSLLNEENARDYFLFINLIKATDNMGKNTYYGQSSASATMEIIPWDLDASWGRLWNAKLNDHLGISSNNLFNRLLTLENFRAKLKQRWLELRGSIWTNQALHNLLSSHFATLNKSGVIAIDNRRWPRSVDLSSEESYMLQWMNDRLVYLDNYFNTL